MTIQTDQQLVIDNSIIIKDAEQVVSTLNYQNIIVNLLEFQHLKEVLAPLWVYTVNFGGIVPTNIKLIANGEVDLSLWAPDIIIANTTYFELWGVVPTVTVTNNSTTKSVDIDIVIAQAQ